MWTNSPTSNTRKVIFASPVALTIASLALVSRFKITCSICIEWPKIEGQFSANAVTISMPDNLNCSPIRSSALITTFRGSIGSGFSFASRPNIRIWSIIAAARAVCPSIRSSLSLRYCGSMIPLEIFRRLLPAAIRMTLSGWFNSWATDVAISPNVASLDDWIIWAAANLRSVSCSTRTLLSSVISWPTPTTPVIFPEASRRVVEFNKTSTRSPNLVNNGNSKFAVSLPLSAFARTSFTETL